MTIAFPQGGVYAIEWASTQIDGATGMDPSWLRIGASWQWRGPFIRLDGTPSAMSFSVPDTGRDIRAHARVIAHRLCGTLPPPKHMVDTCALWAGEFSLTDGRTTYIGRLTTAGQKMLVVFEGTLPPQGMLCWVVDYIPTPNDHSPPPHDVICFASDTMIATPDGARPVALLRAGDNVLTRDNGPQPVRWLGQSTVSGLALRRHPHLRPIRLRRGALQTGSPASDLCVSPAHRIVVTGIKARALFGCEEVLVRARDLIDYTTIVQDLALHGVTYMHVLLDTHQIIFANGVPTESFHPALAPAQTLRDHKQALRHICESWAITPDSYGPTARRCLTAGEAALLAA
jgi:hypothetical protein